MIFSIILFIIVILIVAILLMFLFYILFPSIHNQNKIKEDPIIADDEIEYIKPVKQKNEKSDMKAVVLCSCDKKFERYSMILIPVLLFISIQEQEHHVNLHVLVLETVKKSVHSMLFI